MQDKSLIVQKSRKHNIGAAHFNKNRKTRVNMKSARKVTQGIKQLLGIGRAIST